MGEYKWSEEAIKVLQESYVEYNVPSDKIATIGDHRRAFVRKVNAKLSEPIDADEIVRRLINLRKRGNLPTIRTNRNNNVGGSNEVLDENNS